MKNYPVPVTLGSVMFVFRFALRNVLSRRSSFVIILFIAFSISLLVLANAIFDGTDNGLEKTFVNSFTGNIVIRPKSDFPLSLFGDETPITGSLSEIPLLIPFADVLDYARQEKGVSSVIPQLSGVVESKINGDTKSETTWLFGVDADRYVSQMSGIHILEGRAYTEGEKGIMINETLVQTFVRRSDTQAHVGDNMQLIWTDGVAATIRSVPITGIYRYEVENTALERIALVDPQTLREMLAIQDVVADEDIDYESRSLLQGVTDSESIDALFSEADDVVAEESDAQDFSNAIGGGSEEGGTDNAVWSFLLCRTEDGVSIASVIKRMNRQFRDNDWPVQAVKWRSAAGGTVNLVYYLRIILNVGIILILLTGFIVVNNTLTISALSRVCETGTLRAIGARRSVVARQFFYETAILTVTAGVLGCLLGCAFNMLLLRAHIHIGNGLLVQLFGGDTLRTVITRTNIAACLALSVLFAFLGWLYPVRVALESNPVVAMRGQV